MEFPPLDPRSNFISLELATLQNNSLLLYNPADQGSDEYLALEIVKGKIRLSYNLGSGDVHLQTEKQVADGRFHSIAARRIGNIGFLQLDHCIEEATGFCFSQSEGISSERTLDAGSNNLSFGGVRSMESILLRPGQVQTHDFVGCVRNIKINGVPLGPAKALVAYNILERCPRAAVSPCLSGPCLNGGLCQDQWSHYICQCTHNYTGTTCDTETSKHVLRLGGRGYIEYVVRESYRRELQLRALLAGDRGGKERSRDLSAIEVKVKTVKKDAVLLFVLGGKGHSELRVMGGNLTYIVKDKTSGIISEIAMETHIADGEWHVLYLATFGHSSVLLMDGMTVLNTSDDRALDLSVVNVKKIVLGATPTKPEDTVIQHSVGFTGCVEYIRYYGQVLPVSGYSLIVEVWPSSTLLQSNCESPGTCVSSFCPASTDTKPACPSLTCPTAPACGGLANTRNTSCICLYEATAGSCQLCSSPPPEDLREGAGAACSVPQALGGPSAPLWIVGVVLPVTSLLLFLGIGMYLCQRKLNTNAGPRFQKSRANCGSPWWGEEEEEEDNKGYCFEGPRTTRTVVVAAGKPPDVIQPDGQKEAAQEGYSTGGCREELEYYEIDSIYSVFRLDTSSPGHTGPFSSDCKRVETGDQNSDDRDRPVVLWQRPLTYPDGLVHTNPDHSCDSRGPECTWASRPPYKIDEDGVRKGREQSFFRMLAGPSPPQCLSAEEVSRLNIPTVCHWESAQILQHVDPLQLYQQSVQSAQWSRPCEMIRGMDREVKRVLDNDSDSDTNSSFTCSEVNFGRDFSVLATQGLAQQTLVPNVTHRLKEESLPVQSPFRDLRLPFQAQRGAEVSGASDRPQYLQQFLNMGICFYTYASVFDDIAELPMEQTAEWGQKGDQEEII
uniref:EGF-like domain-containing protein n=2 Tax=Esox lucius TaxID=8010 RepID=A0A3P8XR24_ESOLU